MSKKKPRPRIGYTTRKQMLWCTCPGVTRSKATKLAASIAEQCGVGWVPRIEKKDMGPGKPQEWTYGAVSPCGRLSVVPQPRIGYSTYVREDDDDHRDYEEISSFGRWVGDGKTPRESLAAARIQVRVYLRSLALTIRELGGHPMTEPPLFEGGQGHSAEDVHASGIAILVALLIGVAFWVTIAYMI